MTTDEVFKHFVNVCSKLRTKCAQCNLEFKNNRALQAHLKTHVARDTSRYTEANLKRWSDPRYKEKMRSNIQKWIAGSIAIRQTDEFRGACSIAQKKRFSDPELRKRWAESRRGAKNGNWKGGQLNRSEHVKFMDDSRIIFRRAKWLIKRNDLEIEILDLGYTAGDLKRRIEKQFTNEMNWDNWGIVWHIDHIYPVSRFEIGTSPKIVHALDNLRPLTILENLSKADKVIETRAE